MEYSFLSFSLSAETCGTSYSYLRAFRNISSTEMFRSRGFMFLFSRKRRVLVVNDFLVLFFVSRVLFVSLSLFSPWAYACCKGRFGLLVNLLLL